MRNGETHEKGISAYEADWDATRKLWHLEPSRNIASLDELLYQARKGIRKVYLLKGEEVFDDDFYPERGADGEPLIKNVKIVKELSLKDFYVLNDIHDPTDEDCLKIDLDEIKA
jgi:hypothetical protein